MITLLLAIGALSAIVSLGVPFLILVRWLIEDLTEKLETEQ
jgi:hypothetical protein